MPPRAHLALPGHGAGRAGPPGGDPALSGTRSQRADETLEFDLTQSLASGENLPERVARECPLSMFLGDLHDADNTLLDCVGRMSSEMTRVPLFIVAAARPQLFDRCPGWGGGTPQFTTMSIDPPVAAWRTPAKLAAAPANRSFPGLADCTP
ncbi:hypothetical protein EV562_101900 [Streptomyces sp. BK208]|uniref:hypothetical protein n=1 Tax=Streptomyces sp. BK208 TaxID=2512150 RepID=UPI00105EE060|nr:hypothetical protein [Streptomyces sp. BK208]TDT42925.1 hypothetical protein EV562_101900 [Streptomyces sp. BK208]